MADRNRLESGRWQKCQPRVRIPPPLPAAPLEGTDVQFHLARSYVVGALGWVAVVAGAGVLGVTVVTAMAPGRVRTVALVLAWAVVAAGIALTLVAAVRTLRPPVLVALDDEGVRVRVRRGTAPRSIPWAQVKAVRRESRPAGGCVLVVRTDGETAAVPDRLVAEGGDALAAALRRRLDLAHGQRRLGREAGADDGGGGGI